ncbi:MAG: hypothetical protein ABR898_02100 [Terracidiphilus sp.]|jgi:hypothetical protein
MLIELWEHLRGYDRWTSAVATVQSSALAGVGFGDACEEKNGKKYGVGWQLVCKIVWQDNHCIQHAAEFEAFEESPLYQLCEGDTVKIRFNPDRPAEFYLPGILQSNLARTWKLGVFAVMAILVVSALVIAWFGAEIMNAVSR